MIKTLEVVTSVMLLTIASTHANVDVELKGQLLPPICVVHDGNHGTMQTDFGDEININRLDGKNYSRNIPYKLECESDGQQWQLRFKFIGSSNSWDSNALVTTDRNLGIRLMLDGKVIDLNRDIPIDGNHLPLLSAVPVKNATTLPKEGAFSATANLLAEYY